MGSASSRVDNKLRFGNDMGSATRNKFVIGQERGPAKDKIFLEPVTTKVKRVIEIAHNEHKEHKKTKNKTLVKKESNTKRISKINNVENHSNHNIWFV